MDAVAAGGQARRPRSTAAGTPSSARHRSPARGQAGATRSPTRARCAGTCSRCSAARGITDDRRRGPLASIITAFTRPGVRPGVRERVHRPEDRRPPSGSTARPATAARSARRRPDLLARRSPGIVLHRFFLLAISPPRPHRGVIDQSILPAAIPAPAPHRLALRRPAPKELMTDTTRRREHRATSEASLHLGWALC